MKIQRHSWRTVLIENGVELTNNQAECTLRLAVLWCKDSNGIAGLKGNQWVERTLSLRQTCRQLGQSTYAILVDAPTCRFRGIQPDLTWELFSQALRTSGRT